MLQECFQPIQYHFPSTQGWMSSMKPTYLYHHYDIALKLSREGGENHNAIARNICESMRPNEFGLE